MELKDTVTIVTGGASGIGRAICHAFAAEGATVVAVDINADGAAETAREIGGVAMTANVAEEADMRRVVERTIARFGRVDLMFSNAGIQRSPGQGASGVDSAGRGRELGGELGGQHDGARLRGAGGAAAHAGAGPGLYLQHGLRGGAADVAGVGVLRGDQARGGGVRGVPRDDLRGRRHPRLVPVPAGRRDTHVDRRKRREYRRGGFCWRECCNRSRWPTPSCRRSARRRS